MTATTKTALGELPGMDDIKIGPGGETFGQLKDAVLAARAAYTHALSEGSLRLHPEIGESLQSAVGLLRAAYTRVGLPYRAP